MILIVKVTVGHASIASATAWKLVQEFNRATYHKQLEIAVWKLYPKSANIRFSSGIEKDSRYEFLPIETLAGTDLGSIHIVKPPSITIIIAGKYDWKKTDIKYLFVIYHVALQKCFRMRSFFSTNPVIQMVYHFPFEFKCDCQPRLIVLWKDLVD